MRKRKLHGWHGVLCAGAPCILALLVISSAVIRVHGPFQVMQIAADRVRVAQTPSELGPSSDLIVVAQPVAPGKNVHSFFPGTNAVMVGYMKTVLIVEEVIKGDIRPGERVTITEECYTTNLGATLWTQGGYLPARTGETYLFFLKAYRGRPVYDGVYYPVDLEYGRYLLSADASYAAKEGSAAERMEQLALGPAGNMEDYGKWYDDV